MLSPLRLLIIEDNPGDINLLRLHLRDLDRRADCVFISTGEEALNYISSGGDGVQPHVIVLDLNLPRIGGFELLEHIRASSISHSPVIIFSSSDNDSDRLRAKKMAVDKYIIKPNNLDDYASAIGQIYNIALRHSRKLERKQEQEHEEE